MENNLIATHPEVAAEWHPTKNGDLLPSMVPAGRNKKAWWLGKCDHEWEASIGSRTGKKPVGCPVCAGRQVLVGFNDLASQSPEIAKLWHPTLNEGLTPEQVTAGSNRKVWWLCSAGHTFDDPIVKRTTAAHPCPVCINKRCLTGVNDVETLYPHLLEEWDVEKNEGLSLATMIPGSPKQVWWRCPMGHSWRTEVRSRTQKNVQCLFCSGQKTLTGFNDLLTERPDLAAQWHPTKNGDLRPETVHSGAGKVVWWQCAKGHDWQASINDRKFRGMGCPSCSGRVSIIGETDLVTTHPALAAEWHPTKNGDLLPSMISAGSQLRIWWQCENGHEWQTHVYNRKAGKGCFHCSPSTSKAEVEIYEYLKNLLPEGEVLHRDKTLIRGKELDIYIPSKKIAVEFNGIYWHTEKAGKDKDYHYDKWLTCKNEGVQLIQVWEDEWQRNPDQIKAMLSHKLGVSTGKKVFARNTSVVEVPNSQAEEFLTENHVQGFASGSYYVGLRAKNAGKLVALMVLKKEAGSGGKVLNIIRYATAANVVGGFTKLLAFAERSYKPESFITFSDHCVSDGGLYERNGFVADKELAPDYMYATREGRKHKFGYRLKRFKNDPSLIWAEGLTEAQLAELNGLSRIWDAGKTRWMKHTDRNRD